MQELDSVIQQAAQGDREAFTTIVQRFQDMAVGYAYSVLGDFQLAEDAAQEAFVQIHRDLIQLREPQAFASWFRTVIYKQCDRLIRRKRLPELALESAATTLVAPTSVSDLIERAELRQAVQAALLALPEAQRRVVTLFYIADYSQKEIAAFLDVPVTTVKKRLYNAKQRLKETMMELAQDYLQEQRPSRDPHFQDKVLAVIAPDQARHGEAIYALFEMAERPDTFQWRAGRLAHSHVDWQVSRIGTLRAPGQPDTGEAAQIVAAMHVYKITMRIGTARVQTAGFNCEVTHPAYADQRSTLLDRTVTSSLAAMRSAGYELAISFDDETFWLNKGFVLGWRALQWQVAVADLPTARGALQLHRFEPHHRADLAQLYNETHSYLTGTAARPTYLRNKHPIMFMGWYWTDEQGKPVGYISGGGDRHFTFDAALQDQLDRGVISEALRHQFASGAQWENPPLSAAARCTVQRLGSQWLIEDGERNCFVYREGDQLQAVLFDRPLFWVDEVAGDPALCLQALAQLARQWQCTELFFDRLHYKSGVGKRLRQMVSCRIHTGTYSRSPRAYVLRIINLQSLMTKLVGELTQRLQASPYAAWRGNMLITLAENGSAEEVMLAIHDGVVTIAPVVETDHKIRGGQALAQLIVGSETPDEIVQMADVEVSGDVAMLLPVLFPAQYPQMGNQGL